MTTLGWTGKHDRVTFQCPVTSLQVSEGLNLLTKSVCKGASAGIMEHIGMFPMDTIKVS